MYRTERRCGKIIFPLPNDTAEKKIKKKYSKVFDHPFPDLTLVDQ